MEFVLRAYSHHLPKIRPRTQIRCQQRAQCILESGTGQSPTALAMQRMHRQAQTLLCRYLPDEILRYLINNLRKHPRRGHRPQHVADPAGSDSARADMEGQRLPRPEWAFPDETSTVMRHFCGGPANLRSAHRCIARAPKGCEAARR